MNNSIDKILTLEELIEKVRELRKQGKTVVQSHGIFDLIHPGIIEHLKSAKEQGDVLVITVVKSKDVRRGPGRPVFNENQRAENAASLSMADFVAIVDDEKPFECVSLINPDIFAKGSSIKESALAHEKEIFEEEKELLFGKIKIYETRGFSASSTEILKDLIDIIPDSTKKFLKDFSRKYSFENVRDQIEALKKLKVLLIGDGIIDEYHYCETMGKSLKASLVVHRYLDEETFAGGAFAIANHLSCICKEVEIFSLLGRKDSKEEFIRQNLRDNVKATFFTREDSPTIVKRRYVNQYLNQKMFEINYLNDCMIEPALESEIIKHIKSEIKNYDIILLSDFGHGFITPGIIDAVQGSGKKFAVNTQTNAANIGYNLITKYKSPTFVCLDEPELRWAGQDKFSDIEKVAEKVLSAINGGSLIVTMGKKGSLGINRKREVNRTPIFSSKVIDTVGAGDAFFAYTAPCLALDMPLDLVSFIGNIVGNIAVQIVCNRRPVEKYEVLEFIRALLK
jgi:rfaE bifunctional protein kinase chain/domain